MAFITAHIDPRLFRDALRVREVRDELRTAGMLVDGIDLKLMVATGTSDDDAIPMIRAVAGVVSINHT